MAEPAGAPTPPQGVFTSARAALVAATVLLVVTMAVDRSVDPDVLILTVFLGLSPLVASAALGPAPTAAFGVAAVAAALVSGVWNGVTPQYWVRVVDVAA